MVAQCNQASCGMDQETLEAIYDAWLDTLTLEELYQERERLQRLVTANVKITRLVQKKPSCKAISGVKLTREIKPCLKRLLVASGDFSMRVAS